MKFTDMLVRLRIFDPHDGALSLTNLALGTTLGAFLWRPSGLLLAAFGLAVASRFGQQLLAHHWKLRQQVQADVSGAQLGALTTELEGLSKQVAKLNLVAGLK